MDERSIFLAALEKENVAERAVFLDDACGDDSQLRWQVEALLAAHEAPGSFLEKPPLELAITVDKPDANVPLAAGETPPSETSGASPRPATADLPPLSFLSPSDKPDRLGMLGEYEILEVVGRGGMGIVFRALDPRLNRIVAVKVLAPELASQATAVQRFLREARAAATVNHPNVVNIYHVEDKHRPPFLVMEFIPGRSLQQKIDERGALSVKEILRIGMQAAAGIAAAHAQGLVHRDIKPANILLENGVERVKITDFGLARAVDDVGMTKTGQVLGTPQYMSPEQAGNGETVDARTDQFSLGCVLYAMATGRPPFRGHSTMEVLLQVCERDPRPVRDINPDIPEWLEEIIEKLMAKDKEDRFTTVTAVAGLLEGHLAHLQQPQASPMPAPVRSLCSRAQPRSVRRRSNGRPLVAVLIAVGVLILGALPLLVCAGIVFFYVMLAPSSYDTGPIQAHGPQRVGHGGAMVGPMQAEAPAVVWQREQMDLLNQLENLPKLVSVKSFPLPIRAAVGQQFNRGRIAPNGRYLAVITDRLSIFDLQSHMELHDLPVYGFDAAFSPDSKTVAYVETDTDKTKERYLTFLTIESGQKRRVEQPLRRMFNAAGICLAFSGDGKTVALGGGHYLDPGNVCFGQALLFDVQDGKFLRTVELPKGFIRSVALSPDGRRLLAVGEYKDGRQESVAVLVDLAADKQHDLIPKDYLVGTCTGAFFSPDGTKIGAAWAEVVINRQAAFVWDPNTRQTLGQIAGLGALPAQSGLVISPDSKRLVVPIFQNKFPGPVGMVVNLETCQPEAVLWRGNRGGSFPHAIGFAEGGRTILTVDSDGTVHHWGEAEKKR
jgi:serine/threonine protein kinase